MNDLETESIEEEEEKTEEGLQFSQVQIMMCSEIRDC